MLDLVGNPEDRFSHDTAHNVFGFLFNVPVNNFLVILGHRFLGIYQNFGNVGHYRVLRISESSKTSFKSTLST